MVKAVVNLLNTCLPSCQPAVNNYKVHAWSTTNEFATRTGKFTQTKLKHNTKQKALFFHVNWKTRELSVTYVAFPALVATSIVAVLQAPDGKDSG